MLAAALEPDFSDKILSGGCVDVTTYALPEDRKSIGIATIRELKYKTQILPQELSSNIFIVRDAHTMTPEAQNSLLKVLEEPPAGVYIFLLCDTAAALLPTVRSRAPSLRMQIFTVSDLPEKLLLIWKAILATLPF
jgi:DNA polymerase-3 subunit delta'